MSFPYLIADIGGTHARFAVVDETRAVSWQRQYHCENFAGLFEALCYYSDEIQIHVERAVLSIATPLRGDQVTMTNLNWSFSIQALQKQMAWSELAVINDFHAIALSIPYLTTKDYIQYGGGDALPDRPIAVIGAGTGLGASWLLRHENRVITQATEGGHVTLPVRTQKELDLVQMILKQNPHYSHVSAERIVSGKGIINIYKALCELDNKTPRFENADEIAKAGIEETCEAAKETIDLFCHFFGSVAGNQALTLGAQGGVYLAGGIVPRWGKVFLNSRFRVSFEDKGRFKSYLAPIPVYVITNQNPAFLGLAHYFDS